MSFDFESLTKQSVLEFSILAQMLRYSPYLNLSLAPCWCGWQKKGKRLYLSPWAKILKTKGILFPSTLKVWEGKVPLVFSIFAQGLKYSHFFIFRWPNQQGAILEYRRMLYLSLWAKIEKTKGTLFSSVLSIMPIHGGKKYFVLLKPHLLCQYFANDSVIPG